MGLKKVNCVVVCGPTASGKTRLAVLIARLLGAEIVSCDSRQVYKGMDIGTGKDREEYQTPDGIVPCHGIDLVSPTEVFTLYHYQNFFYDTFRSLRGRGIIPVVCGGTGLYLEAVLRHFSIPNVPEDRAFREACMHRDITFLQKELRRSDEFLYNRTDRSSKKRIVRALEIARYSAQNPVQWGYPDPPHIEPLVLGIRRSRDEQRQLIDRRLDARLREGMVEEVRHLLTIGVPESRMLMIGLEYKFITMYIRGKITYHAMVEDLRTAIHRFAKRQETYFRGMQRRGIPIVWIAGNSLESAVGVLERYGLNTADKEKRWWEDG